MHDGGSTRKGHLAWWQRPVIILAHQYDQDLSVERDPQALERLVQWKRSMGFDAEHLLLNYSMMQGAEGGDDSRAYLFRNRHGFKEDWLGAYLPIAHKHGLRVIVYFNCHWFKFSAFPGEYFVVDAAGTREVIYGNGGRVCPQGPFRNWSEGLAEDLGRYAIDGVFLDGPSQVPCWCPACRKEFEGRHGAPLPEDPAGCPPALADALSAFPAEGAIGYVKAFAAALRRTNPEAVLYINDSALGSDGAVMAATADITQFVGAEGGFIGYRPLTGRFPFEPGAAAKVLQCRATGRGRVIFSDCAFKSFDYHAHPRGEIARMYAGTIGNGANPWFLVIRSAQGSEGIQTARRFNRLIAENRDALTASESLAEAALVHCPLNFRLARQISTGPSDDVGRRAGAQGSIEVARHYSEFQGLYAALARSGYPFDVIEPANILEGGVPERIGLLILPALGAVSDSLAEALRDFVSSGGRLLATFDSTLYDDAGRRREDFALADVFGASVTGELQGPSKLDYLAATERNELTRDLSQEVLPCAEYWWLVRAHESARPLLYYRQKMPRRYAQLPPVSDHPAALLNDFGRGQAIFIPSAIGDHYLNWRFPDERLIIRNAACLLAPPRVEVQGGDEFVETALRRGADGSVVLHLTNYASGERPASRAIPIGPLEIAVRLPADFDVSSAAGRFLTGRLQFTHEEGQIWFRLPRLEEYEMVVIR